MHAPFVGRREELDRLLSLVGTGRTAVGVVLGAPGAGKTRLLQETVDRTSATPLDIVGYESEASVPLAAARPLLTALGSVPTHGDRLQGLLFGTAQTAPPSLHPLRVFEASYRCLAAATSPLIVVDDLQWVDGASRALLHYLLRASHTSGIRVPVLAAARPGPTTLDFIESLHRIVRDGGVETIDLKRLDVAAGVELIQQIDPAQDHDAATALWEAAGGSPFWLVAAAGARDAAELETLVDRWLATCAPDAAELVELLSVGGRPLRVAEIADLLGWPHPRAAAAMVALSNTPLAAAEGGAARLAHDLLTSRVLRRLQPDRRLALHATLARHLRDSAGDDVGTLLRAVHHARQAGAVPVELALRVATAPGRRLVGVDGLHDLLRTADASDPGTSGVLQLQRALAVLASELGKEETALERWTALAQADPDERARAWAALSAARAAFRLRRSHESLAMIARARRTSDQDLVLAASTDALEAVVLLWSRHRLGDAASLSARAAAALRQLQGADRHGDGDPAVTRDSYLQALNSEYDIATVSGDDDAMLRIAEEMVRAADHQIARLDAEREVAVTLAMAGRAHEAEHRLRRLCEITEEQVLPSLWVDAAYGLASVWFDLGRLKEAAELVERVVALADRTGKYPMREATIQRLRHRLAVHRGSWAEALQAFLLQADAEADVHLRLAALEEAALWRARIEGPGAADPVRAAVEAGSTCSTEAGCPRCGSRFALLAAEALVRIGDIDAAEQRVAQWRPLPGAAAPSSFWRRRTGILIALARGQPGGEDELGSLVGEAEEAGWMIDALWCRLDWSAASRGRDATVAVTRYQETARMAVSMGAPTVERLAGQALRALGVRNWRRGSADPSGRLTRREQEVAQLVATGLTNREVADALFLSPKTVERHISNALAKVGARNRTELATYLADPQSDQK